MTYSAEERKTIVEMSLDTRTLLYSYIARVAEEGQNEDSEVRIDSGMILQAISYACATVIGELTNSIPEAYRDFFVQDFVLKAITSGQASAELRLNEIEKTINRETDMAIKKAFHSSGLH